MDPTALGRYLRESRESRELTLEEAVHTLRIRRPILEAFERGEFDVADTPVRVRGMLRNYAQYLGLEEDRILEYYEAAQTDHHRKRRSRKPVPQPVAPRRITDTPPALPAVKVSQPRTYQWGNALRTVMMLAGSVAAVGFIIFVMIQTTLRPDDPADENLPVAAVGDGTPTATYTATWTPLPVVPVSPTAAAVGITGINIEVRITQRTWMRVQVDGVESFAGIMEAGQQVQYQGNNMVVLVAANAAGIDVTFNGTLLPAYGTRGQQVQLEFTPAGVNAVGAGVVPVATDLPTMTPTPEITATAAEIAGASAPIGSSSVQQDGTVLPSPTPLFTSEPLPGITQESGQPTPDASLAVTQPPGSSTPEPATATSLPPTATATESAILPPRITPDNPTPTKTG